MRPWQRREAEGSDTIADVTETRNLCRTDVKPFTLLVKYQARWSLRCTTTRVKKFVYWGRNAREAITKKSAKNCCSCSLRPHQWWVTIQKNMYWKSSVLHVQALQFSSFTNKLQERNHLAPPHDITSLPSPLHSTPSCLVTPGAATAQSQPCWLLVILVTLTDFSWKNHLLLVKFRQFL